MATTNNSGPSRPQPGRDPLTYPAQTVSPGRPGFIPQRQLQRENLLRSNEQKKILNSNNIDKMNSMKMNSINVSPIGNSLGSGNGINLFSEINKSKAAEIMKNQKQKK